MSTGVRSTTRALCFRASLIDCRGLTERIASATVTLADAQLVVAREYGFTSWGALKHYVEVGGRVAKLVPHPRFPDALAALPARPARQDSPNPRALRLRAHTGGVSPAPARRLRKRKAAAERAARSTP